MPVSRVIRRGLIGAAALLCVMGLGLASLLVAVDAGYFRGAVVSYLESSSHRRIGVSGSFRAHLWSLHPRLTAEGVTIGNPLWTPPGITAQIEVLTLVVDLPRWGHPGRIESLRMQGAKLTLYRDVAGHANWQRADPDQGDAKGLPLIASLSAVNAHVLLNDERRHLQFDGTVSAEDAKRSGGELALQIQGAGQLNGNAVTFELTGDALPAASHEHPYRFSFSENSSGSHLTAQGSLPKPFDFNLLEAGFEASGADLKDLYFLTGVGLVNTGSYRLAGNYSRDHSRIRFSDLHFTTGQSDVSGTMSVDAASGRSRSIAKFHAQTLHLADFGRRAAGRETERSSLLLSTAAANVDALRRGDAAVEFDAHRVEVGRQVLQDFTAKLAIERGVVTATPIAAKVLGGKLSGRVKLDATQAVPLADVDLSIAGLQLAQLPHKSADPPLEGALRIRLKLTGRGSSVHEVAAAAEGTATAILPQGAVRDSLAELAGMDLRGLGLTLEKNKRETPVRCAAADFQAHAGVFTVQRMIMDTEPVLINGEGSIHMDTETLDLVLRGEPKVLRVLRLKAPLSIRGTLAHPSFGIEKGDSKLLLVDKGRAKDEDCAALVQ
jgi:uncharacterized protein involved in outer membrane biogenesis